MNSTNVYTGTFTTRQGQTRTMSFVRANDMPASVFEGKQRPHQNSDGQEVVYDVKSKGWRTFNWGTAHGTVRKETIQFSFDNIQK